MGTKKVPSGEEEDSNIKGRGGGERLGYKVGVLTKEKNGKACILVDV
jgi:hypothetical protein